MHYITIEDRRPPRKKLAGENLTVKIWSNGKIYVERPIGELALNFIKGSESHVGFGSRSMAIEEAVNKLNAEFNKNTCSTNRKPVYDPKCDECKMKYRKKLIIKGIADDEIHRTINRRCVTCKSQQKDRVYEWEYADIGTSVQVEYYSQLHPYVKYSDQITTVMSNYKTNDRVKIDADKQRVEKLKCVAQEVLEFCLLDCPEGDPLYGYSSCKKYYIGQYLGLFEAPFNLATNQAIHHFLTSSLFVYDANLMSIPDPNPLQYSEYKRKFLTDLAKDRFRGIKTSKLSAEDIKDFRSAFDQLDVRGEITYSATSPEACLLIEVFNMIKHNVSLKKCNKCSFLYLKNEVYKSVDLCDDCRTKQIKSDNSDQINNNIYLKIENNVQSTLNFRVCDSKKKSERGEGKQEYQEAIDTRKKVNAIRKNISDFEIQRLNGILEIDDVADLKLRSAITEMVMITYKRRPNNEVLRKVWDICDEERNDGQH